MEECHKMLIDQVDWTNPEGAQVKVDVNRPLPVGGPPGHVTIQMQFFFNKDLEYLRYGSKGSSPALSISKMKAARYPDFGLELLVPEHMWINDVCTYDISAIYGISHWWFNQQKFYIDRHDSLSHRKEVRTHMRILSVIRVKAYSRYGYDYLSEIVLRRADFQEHIIAEKDFKNLYPSGFEDLNLLLLQGHLDHLPDFQLGIESYQTQLNLTKLGWDATSYEFKHDYTIIESPRAVVFPIDNNERKIMRFNEIYKFSDGTLTRILEALDYRVKEFKVKRLNLEHPSDTKVLTMKMEILLGQRWGGGGGGGEWTVSRSVGTCGELDAFVSIPDEGDMAFLRKKVKSGAAVGKLVLLQVFVQSRLIFGVIFSLLVSLRSSTYGYYIASSALGASESRGYQNFKDLVFSTFDDCFL
ncbi:hypothetical protein Tco_1334980 [Tanacetum coccineum]